MNNTQSINNMTPCVDMAYESIRAMFNHPETKSKAAHLMLAFGNNCGHLTKFPRPTLCPVTGIRPITSKDVDQIKDPALKRKISEFLLGTKPSKDTDVLEFTANYNWSANDTIYTTAQHQSIKSRSLITRSAYIAVQRLKKELDEKREETRAVETVSVFEVAEPKQKSKKK